MESKAHRVEPPATGGRPLDDEDSRVPCAELARRNAELRAERLAAAKQDAAACGKEPLDLAKLETMCDTSNEGRMAPEPVRYAKFEEMYYVDYPGILTLEDFARKVYELNKWRAKPTVLNPRRLEAGHWMTRTLACPAPSWRNATRSSARSGSRQRSAMPPPAARNRSTSRSSRRCATRRARAAWPPSRYATSGSSRNTTSTTRRSSPLKTSLEKSTSSTS